MNRTPYVFKVVFFLTNIKYIIPVPTYYEKQDGFQQEAKLAYGKSDNQDTY